MDESAAAAELVEPTPAPAPAAVFDLVTTAVDKVLIPELTAVPEALPLEAPDAKAGTRGTREPDDAAAAALEASRD